MMELGSSSSPLPSSLPSEHTIPTNIPKSLVQLGFHMPPAGGGTLSHLFAEQRGGTDASQLAAQLDQLQQLLGGTSGEHHSPKHHKTSGSREMAKDQSEKPLIGTSTSNPLPSTVISFGGEHSTTQLPNLQLSLADLFAPPGAPPQTQSALTAAPTAAVAQHGQQLSPEDTSPPSEGKHALPKEATCKFRGVTRHKRSGRFEAHIWSKSVGRQIYLGGYECPEHAAEAYDIAALKCKGRRTKTNFDISKYEDLLSCIDRMTLEELVMAVRRQSQGFSRGSSSFRGVTLHPTGRYEARIGVPGSKHIYLGLFADERLAAAAYDRSLVRLRGRGAATNFSLGDYKSEMADYHVMQGKILIEDPRFLAIQEQPHLFDKWIRDGLAGFPELTSMHVLET